MNDTQLKVGGMLLKLASDSYAKNGCNDFTLPNTPEHQELWRDAMAWAEGGRVPEGGPGAGESIFFYDWILMGYMAHILDQERFHTLGGPTRDELLGMIKAVIAYEERTVGACLKKVMALTNGAANPKLAAAMIEVELLKIGDAAPPTVKAQGGPAIIIEGDVSIGEDLLVGKRVQVTFQILGDAAPPERKFSNIRVERTEARIQGSKRQHAPYVVVATCACGNEREISLNDQYLSYPTWGETETIHLYCPKCELEQSCRVRVDINAKFDQTLLQFNGTRPLGEWNDHNKWEDTFILAYLRNPRARRKGLKFLSGEDLGLEMIELAELFGGPGVKDMDFSTLDPEWEPVLGVASGAGLPVAEEDPEGTGAGPAARRRGQEGQ